MDEMKGVAHIVLEIATRATDGLSHVSMRGKMHRSGNLVLGERSFQ
jgi:hypothetical protein